MAIVPRIKRTYECLIPLVVVLLMSSLNANGQQLPAPEIKKLPDCSLAKTNRNCKLTIDRAIPLAPPPVQMYSNQALTVIVKNPKSFERYFLDFQSGQANISPDVATGIVQGLLPSLSKAEEIRTESFVQSLDSCKVLLTQGTTAAPVTVPKDCPVKEFVATYEIKLISFGKNATLIYRELEPFVSPDSLLPSPPTFWLDGPKAWCRGKVITHRRRTHGASGDRPARPGYRPCVSFSCSYLSSGTPSKYSDCQSLSRTTFTSEAE